MKRTTLCPCGSGKPQARCCGDTAKTRINPRMIVTWFFIILIGTAITVIALNVPSGETPIANVGATPAPYQYDPITNKHWDPAHGHWHDGRAPVGATESPVQLSDSGISATSSLINPTISSLLSGVSTASGSEVPAPTNITNPTAWQYDIATDRHYNPNHAHWHSGRPPNDPAETSISTSGGGVPAPPNISNPQPWQYDIATDRYYHADHAHWHSGSPPGGN